MTSKSLWMDIDVAPGAEVMNGVHECDVAVIGSGIAGISTAYELCKRGKSVIVVDRGRICGGMTSRTSAHLAPLCDDLVSEMTKIKGHDATKLFCDSQAAAVDRIEEIQKNEKIDCDFRRLDGYLFQGRDMPADTIDQEMDRFVRSEPPSTGWWVCRSMAVKIDTSCAIPGRRPSIRSNISPGSRRYAATRACLFSATAR
jgi:hypothetical protein